MVWRYRWRVPAWLYYPRFLRCVDLYVSLPANTHMDATSVRFAEHLIEDRHCLDWIVTSPPYTNALIILKNAIQIATVGVAFKLRLNFLKPIPSRAQWLKKHPPSSVIVLSRATYRGRQASGVKAWLVWNVRPETVYPPSFFWR